MNRPHVIHVPGYDPERDRIVKRLVDELDACVHTDPHRRGSMETWLLALGCAVKNDDPDEWTVMLEDDAEPLPTTKEELPVACAHSPSPILGLTYFGGFGSEALRRHVAYLVGPNLIWGGAIAYHHSVVRPLYTWAMQVAALSIADSHDVLVCEYSRRLKLDTALTARAVFDQPVNHSMLGHNGKYRRPTLTINHHQDQAWEGSIRYGSRKSPGRTDVLDQVPDPDPLTKEYTA